MITKYNKTKWGRGKFLSKNPSETKKLGELLAKKILKRKPASKKALVIGLRGDLGGGKTTFLQGFAKGLGVKGKILSPTFIILKKFAIRNSQFKKFYHIDCYRIEKSEELTTLGFKDIILDPKNIVAIEWAEKIKEIMPKNALILEFEFASERQRNIGLGSIRLGIYPNKLRTN